MKKLNNAEVELKKSVAYKYRIVYNIESNLQYDK